MQKKGTAEARRLVKTRERGIYKRGNRYVVRFYVNGLERKRFARTLAEARELRSQALADVSRGEYREATKLPFAEYVAGWLDGYSGRTSRGIRPTTIDGYRRVLEDEERGAIAFFGRRRLSELSPPDIKAYVKSLTDRGLSTSTVRNYLTPVRAALADAFEDGLIRVNPAARVRITGPGGQLPRRPATSNTLARSPTNCSRHSSPRHRPSTGCSFASSPRPGCVSAKRSRCAGRISTSALGE